MILAMQQLDFPNGPIWLVVPIVYGVMLVASLFWSLCFGWLFVKLDNCLNHFPVLGRKVF